MALNRFYYPTKYKVRADFLSKGVKCVFIAHQQKDKPHARKVADYLENAGIDIYFDENDSELRIHHQNNNPKRVTESICVGINNSSHMLVIVSPNTISSTWVPFEIGYAFDKTELGVLCLKGIPKGSLPEYIRTAPIIRDIYDFNSMISRLAGRSVIGNHNCRIFRNQEYSVFGNKEYIGFGNKGAEEMATRNAEICRINIFGNGTNPLFIKAYGLS